MRPAFPILDLGLLGDLQGVIDLDTKVSDGALQFCLTEQELDGPQVLCPFVPAPNPGDTLTGAEVSPLTADVGHAEALMPAVGRARKFA